MSQPQPATVVRAADPARCRAPTSPRARERRQRQGRRSRAPRQRFVDCAREDPGPRPSLARQATPALTSQAALACPRGAIAPRQDRVDRRTADDRPLPDASRPPPAFGLPSSDRALRARGHSRAWAVRASGDPVWAALVFGGVPVSAVPASAVPASAARAVVPVEQLSRRRRRPALDRRSRRRHLTQHGAGTLIGFLINDVAKAQLRPRKLWFDCRLQILDQVRH